MYIEKESLPNIYGCFRCGSILGDEEETEDGELRCLSCGEVNCIVTFKQALDVLNDMRIQGKLRVEYDDTEYELGEFDIEEE